ncbi:hypothetical protein F8388_014706 [Cannabis sativa]|uniref:Uncharacterized protein n=1 Tax=Cannabis sativa TaxID=3483 RepID=A0A7J6E4A8_CANSA|nr:hypothetical protein F8388_014706 [Cannabis sativa]
MLSYLFPHPLMALTIPNGGGGTSGASIIFSGNPTKNPNYTHFPIRRHLIFPHSSRNLHVAVSAKKFSSRSGRVDGNKNRRSTTTTRDQELEEINRTADLQMGLLENAAATGSAVNGVDDGYFLPKLPGEEKDFWEGEQWDWLGFLVEYLWAFGIVFSDRTLPFINSVLSLGVIMVKKMHATILKPFLAVQLELPAAAYKRLVACGVAVSTYNEGATDFKNTPVYKESVQSQELLEEPDASNPDVFESNPTEVAPNLE